MYASRSGQIINTAKSTIYSGSITQGRLALIVNLLNFKLGSLPFNYLGVPLFKGKPKASLLQPIADKIHSKLSAWKASLLSIAGSVQLVKSVIQSILLYNITLYSWPVSLIKKIEKLMKNFIWSGDVDKKKLVTFAWKKICRPLSQGVLNLRSLTSLNKAANLKLCWSFINSQCSWAKLLQARVLRGKKVIQHHIFSSLWSCIKEEINTIFDNSIWLVGDGKDINFWNDNWCGSILSDFFNIPSHISQNLTSTVSDYIYNGEWYLPQQLPQHFNALSSLVHQVTIPIEPSKDKLLWKHTDTGDMQLADAYSFNLQQLQDLHWAKVIWNSTIPPSKSLLAWRLMHNKMPTDDNLKITGCALPSMCSLCCKKEESSFHIFFECEFAIKIWSWFANSLNLVLQFNSMEDINQVRFSNGQANWKSSISMIIANTSMSDGAAKENPGLAGCGGIFRNHVAEMLYCFAEPLGIATSFQAELCAVMTAIEVAHKMKWHNLWIESDSALVVLAFHKSNIVVTWNLMNRWRNVMSLFKQMNDIVTHIYREGNQVADSLANHGCTLSSFTFWYHAPDFIKVSMLNNKLVVRKRYL
ncbi:unnamed protein product [Trifolium pratense]|uniref:Uncharacterized protein n=1 Tax=Trifolium pratense TaxID=57577 RepID=A0ACB0KT28_TRIPR|nr:unnamed protein product [Trifolium pratense]